MPGRPRPPAPLAVVWIILGALTFGLGTYWPANAAIAQQAGRRFAGTASELGGGLPFLCGSLTTALTGALGHQNLMTMTSCMAVFFAVAAMTAAYLRNATVYIDDGERIGLEPIDARAETAKRKVRALVQWVSAAGMWGLSRQPG